MNRKSIKSSTIKAVLALAALLAFTCGCSSDQTGGAGGEGGSGMLSASYTVTAGRPEDPALTPISSALYGLFLEDINFALDGGMYAELVKNRSFEYGAAASGHSKHGWATTAPDDDLFEFAVIDGTDDGSSLNSNNPNYAVLANSSNELRGIAGRGFLEGMSVKGGETYIFSGFFMSPDGYSGEVVISIRENNGDTLAQGVLSGIAGEWRKYSLELAPGKSSSDTAITQLTVEIGSGTVWADMLSLMPQDTYKGTSVRKDIGEYLESLNPSFIRFPGGCVIEGRDLETMYNWKDSIGNGIDFAINGTPASGDVAARVQGKSIWEGNNAHPYYTTHGLGFFEFFELCEILGATPVPIVNAGMTCQIQSPRYIVFDTDSDEFKQCLQDALDLAEFCLGGSDTYWGGVRIAMGHPEPFALKYIGVGNEQWQNEYFRHYRIFVEAFEEAALTNPEIYGGIELIVANGAVSGDRMGWDYLDRSPDSITTLVDEHYYESPNWFLTNTDRYDRYSRDTQAKVFLGEYAAQSNTLNAALAEAAYMTGLERNGDIVVMASYAPLFGNRALTQWTPNMIWFSQDSVFGSVNFYVQKLFANNKGVAVLPSSLDTQGLEGSASGALSGKVGLATWQTSAAFDNLTVTDNKTGNVLYSCSFDDEGALQEDGFVVHEGSWSVADGRLAQSSIMVPRDTNTGDAIYVGEASWSDYTLTVEAEKLGGAEGFLIPVCVQDASNNIFWNLGGWGNTVSCLQIVAGGAKSGQVTGTVRNVSLQRDRVYSLKVEVSGNNIKCYIDNVLYIDYTQETAGVLYETASVCANGDIVLKFVNVSASQIDIAVALEGFDASGYKSAAAVTALSGDSLSDANSFDEPEKLTPAESSIEVASGAFTYPAPPYSLSIVRVLAD